jgi:hypothetical protein
LGLLWHGSRDGFGAAAFHGWCDGQPNTLTIIEDTAQNVFGGFTPVEWESPEADGWKWKADLSGRSFLFPLKNPRGIAAERLRLKPGERSWAVHCHRISRPMSGDGCDFIVVCDCDKNTGSFSGELGYSYESDFGRIPASALLTLLTGGPNFRVKEIKVFQIDI